MVEPQLARCAPQASKFIALIARLVVLFGDNALCLYIFFIRYLLTGIMLGCLIIPGIVSKSTGADRLLLRGARNVSWLSVRFHQH